MPRATRKTNTNSGNDVSSAPKLNTLLKNSALTPRAAAKDSTTVAISRTGATKARSSSIRMTKTTARVIGMISVLSCAAARLDVEVDRGIPADERVRSRDGVYRVACPVDGRVGGLAV